MGRTRTRFDHVTPTVATFMKYVEACSAWSGVNHLATEFAAREETVARMCLRLTRCGAFRSRTINIKPGPFRNEFIATDRAKWIFDAIVDGRIPVGLSPAELGAHLRGSEEPGPQVQLAAT